MGRLSYWKVNAREEEISMATYTVRSVERFLRSYLDILCTLEGNTQSLHDTYVTKKKKKTHREAVPFGQTTQGEPWPFMEPKHARSPTDGKTKARFLEDLHCAVLDIEEAFPLLSEDDQYLIREYHITQNKTLDELMVERSVASRGSLHQRIHRAVRRLTYLMEHQKEKNRGTQQE